MNLLTYDAAGNTTYDGVMYSYGYDGENRQTSTNPGNVTYTYDGDGRRVQKSNGSLSWYGSGGEVLMRTDLAGNSPSEYVFFGGKRLAVRVSSGNVYYYLADHLGSSRTIVNSGGDICYDADYYPYGGERVYASSCVAVYKFTGKERDTETGNDYFGARYHASNFGRFLSPDPLVANRSHPRVLEQFLADPQDWNKYAYTRNNPVKYTDPSGRFHPGDHEQMQINAMLASGYSQKAAQVAARANKAMDKPLGVAAGVPGLHHLSPTKENPKHGQRADGQSVEEAAAIARQFVSSQIGVAAQKALHGDPTGAQEDLGRAGHTVQDKVAHKFGTASDHPLVEPLATAGEMQIGTYVTKIVLEDFVSQMYLTGCMQGLGFDQILEAMKKVLGGNFVAADFQIPDGGGMQQNWGKNSNEVEEKNTK